MTDSGRFRAGLVQLSSTGDIAENIRVASGFINQAADEGADFVLTPEVTSILEPHTRTLMEKVTPEDRDLALQSFQALAETRKIWLSIGSMAVLLDDGRLANRSFLIGPDGQIKARYDKIHMFDVELPNGERYHESKNYQAGTKAVLASLPWGKVGLSVCYDLRFPGLYRTYAQAGASFLTVPSAFTKVTGAAHWHILLQARAIETGCFVLAAAQFGDHGRGRETFGHSLIVDPWGEILADGGTGVGVVLANIDVAKVQEARARIPAWRHNAHYELVEE